MMTEESKQAAAAVPQVVQSSALAPSRLFVSFTAVDSGSFSRTAGEN